MAKRFGRNQRRKMRTKIESLKSELRFSIEFNQKLSVQRFELTPPPRLRGEGSAVINGVRDFIYREKLRQFNLYRTSSIEFELFISFDNWRDIMYASRDAWMTINLAESADSNEFRLDGVLIRQVMDDKPLRLVRVK
ncbi:hypothetical protein [Shewanella oncorhynchi]|uniref:hypothetical protein n=1 Tax=Shewanella oncorhynchi TaxID=2726434 RepID=UPI003D7A2BDE